MTAARTPQPGDRGEVEVTFPTGSRKVRIVPAKIKVARKVRALEDWSGDAALYELSVPHEDFDFVVVSAVYAPDWGGPETFIFGATASGNEDDVDFSELSGSQRGTLSHAEALSDAGYEIAVELQSALEPVS